MRTIALTLLFTLQSLLVYAQPNIGKIALEASTILSTNGTPFFIRSNQYGEIPRKNSVLQLAGDYHQEYDSLYTNQKRLKAFGYGFGARIVGNIGQTSQLILPELYGKIRLSVFEFSVGRRKEVFGLVDTTYSSGSYIWSGNALPIPKLQLSIPHYSPLFKSGLLAIKGNFAHGWFGSTDSVQNYLLHQKSLYLRIGKPKWKFKFQVGFNHQVQWGGKPSIPFYDEKTGQKISTFSSDFPTFIKVVTGVSLNKNSDALNTPHGVPANEVLNRAGNHLGTIDLAFSYECKNMDILLYRQSIYEDGSLYYLNNVGDGLNGLSIHFKPKRNNTFQIQGFGFEYLNTMSQGGAGHNGNFIPELRGQDNYFNNSIYKDGWTYKDLGIGTPLIDNLQRDGYRENTTPLGFSNNKVVAYAFSTSGIFKNTRYLLSCIFRQSFGSYSIPFMKKELFWSIAYSKTFKNGFLFSSQLVCDHNLRLSNLRIGSVLSLKKKFY